MVKLDTGRVGATRERCRVLEGDDHPELTAGISSPMRVEAIIVAARAEVAERNVTHTERVGVTRDEQAQVDWRRPISWMTGEPAIDIWTHLVAVTADCRTTVHSQVLGTEPEGIKLADGDLDDARFGTAPAGVQDGGGSARVGDEDGDAVRDGDGHRGPSFRCEVPIRLLAAEPAMPLTAMAHDVVAMDLARGGESRGWPAKLRAKRRPARVHIADRLVSVEPEASCLPRGGERLDAEVMKVLDDLAADARVGGAGGGAHCARRSSTRSMCAPRARSRSSMRS